MTGTESGGGFCVASEIGEWYRPVPILLPASPLLAPVFGVVIASFLFVDCPISVVETILTTIEQRLSTLVSLFEHRITGRAALLLTTTPNKKPRLRTLRL